MLSGTNENVKVELELEHKGIDYIISRTQLYKKDVNGITKPDNSVLDVINKNADGQTFSW